MELYSKHKKIINLTDFESEIREADYTKYFTDKELESFAHKRSKGSLAVRYVLKQLMLKNLNQELNYCDIEVLNNEEGKPSIVLLNEKKVSKEYYFSLSHTKSQALALLVVNGYEPATMELSISESIAFLTLSVPPKNEMSLLFFRDLSVIVNFLKDQRELIGLIISSKGRHFSSGANIEELLYLFSGSSDVFPEPLIENGEAIKTISDFPFPVVACIKGICFGSGLELALAAHFRIASANALLSLPETSFGIMPGLGGISQTQKCMGIAKSLELTLSGNSLQAEEALENGLLDFIKEKKSMESFAVHIIKSLEPNYKKELKPIYLKDLS